MSPSPAAIARGLEILERVANAVSALRNSAQLGMTLGDLLLSVAKNAELTPEQRATGLRAVARQIERATRRLNEQHADLVAAFEELAQPLDAPPQAQIKKSPA